MPNAAKQFNEAMKNLPKFDSASMANSKYYKGGFDPKMNRREAALILGKMFFIKKLSVVFFGKFTAIFQYIVKFIVGILLEVFHL